MTSTRWASFRCPLIMPSLAPADTPEDRGATVVFHHSAAGTLSVALNDLEELSPDKPTSVLVLGRYHKSGGVMPARPRPGNGNLSARFSTIHGAKGQETDYVVVLDLMDRRAGFPSRIEDDPSWTWCCLESQVRRSRSRRSVGSSTSR